MTMTRIVLDAESLEKLKNLTESLDLCDESGRVLGRLVPVCDTPEYRPVRPQAGDPDETPR
jgi:hypothetical protein